MTLAFRKAVKTDAKLRMAILGPSGAGKTWTALAVAAGLDKGKVALIDTERGSASKYADEFDFDVLELDSYHPDNYIAAIKAAEEAGYGVCIIDSLSHAWAGKDGALEIVDQETARSKSNNKFVAWGKVTPLQNKLMDTVLGSSCHIIATMRSKMKHVQEQDDKGKTVIRKVGMQPVQRDDVEYEFDVVGDMDQENTMHVTKSRCSLIQGVSIDKPNQDLAKTLAGWLEGVSLNEIVEQEVVAITKLLHLQTADKCAKGLAWLEVPGNRTLGSLTRFRAKLEREGAPKPAQTQTPTDGVQEPTSGEPTLDDVDALEAQAEALGAWNDPKHKANARQKHLGDTPDAGAISRYIDYLTGKIEEAHEAQGKAA